jgi:hypothetical protein
VNPVLLSPEFKRAFLLTADNQDACIYETGRFVQITYLIPKQRDILQQETKSDYHYSKEIYN